MTRRIDPRANLKDELGRIAQIQLAAAATSLRAEGDALHKGVHDTRKRFKLVRGMLRLVRSADRRRCEAENVRLRTMAQSLGVARDAAARVETLDRLRLRFDTPARHRTLTRLRNTLAKRRDRIIAEETDLSQKIETAIAGCEASAVVLGGLDVPAGGKHAARLVSHGFARNYRKAREALAEMQASDEEEAHHTLRKRIRDQWTHTILLANAWPSAFAARKMVLKSAIDLLGNDRDLIVLSEMIAEEPDEIGSAPDLRVLRTCIKQQSRELNAAIVKTTAGLLREEPEIVRRRIRHLWSLAAKGK